MSIFTWVNTNIKKMTWSDMSLVKLSIAAFVLMIAKLWPDILSLEWYWYLVIFLLTMLKPFLKFFKE